MAQMNSKASATLTRRGLLSAVSAMSVLSLSQWPGQSLAGTLDVDAFLALSQKLVGQTDLSPEIAAGMLQALTATGREDAVAALAADGKSDDELANTIVTAWYTGESPDPDDLKVLTYADAMVWQAMDYSKPMAWCGGGVGYWANPPEV